MKIMSCLQGETECHKQQMVRNLKGDSKTMYKVMKKPRQKNPRMFVQKVIKDGDPCMSMKKK